MSPPYVVHTATSNKLFNIIILQRTDISLLRAFRDIVSGNFTRNKTRKIFLRKTNSQRRSSSLYTKVTTLLLHSFRVKAKKAGLKRFYTNERQTTHPLKQSKGKLFVSNEADTSSRLSLCFVLHLRAHTYIRASCYSCKVLQ